MRTIGLVLYGVFASGTALALPLLLTAGLLPDGTWYWAQALIAVGVFAVMQAVGIVVLMAVNPQSIEVRNQSILSGEDKKQPLADRIVSTFLVLAMFGLLVFTPIDVFELRLMEPVGATAALFGGGLAIAGLVFTYIAVG